MSTAPAEKSAVLTKQGTGSTAVPEARIQVETDSGWQDLPQECCRQISRSIALGVARFAVQSDEERYIVDLSGPEGMMETCMSTGEKRRLRILDGEQPTEDDDSASPCAAAAALEARQRQRQLGPQSLRGGAAQGQLDVVANDPHAKACFDTFLRHEAELCEEWAVFYHAYSLSALIYEVNAAIASELFAFDSEEAPLPRLLVREFLETPDAKTLISKYNSTYASARKDHTAEYRAVALSAMCSLVALGPELSIPVFFMQGYSNDDLSFSGVLEALLASCYVPKDRLKRLARDIVSLSEKHGLDVSQYGGQPCNSGKAGHLMQIFIKRTLVDELSYAAHPFGEVDKSRHPMSEWLVGDARTSYGQARIVAHPKLFMQPDKVRIFVASADEEFHQNRRRFQRELTELFSQALGGEEQRHSAATGVYGGTLPAYWPSQEASAPTRCRAGKLCNAYQACMFPWARSKQPL